MTTLDQALEALDQQLIPPTAQTVTITRDQAHCILDALSETAQIRCWITGYASGIATCAATTMASTGPREGDQKIAYELAVNLAREAWSDPLNRMRMAASARHATECPAGDPWHAALIN